MSEVVIKIVWGALKLFFSVFYNFFLLIYYENYRRNKFNSCVFLCKTIVETLKKLFSIHLHDIITDYA